MKQTWTLLFRAWTWSNFAGIADIDECKIKPVDTARINPHIDMGQGLLQCISEIYEQIHQEKSTEWV